MGFSAVALLAALGGGLTAVSPAVIGVLGAYGAVALGAVVATGISYIGQTALAKKPAAQGITPAQVLDNPAGGNAPIPPLYGFRRVGASRIFWETGFNNKLLHLVYSVCEGEIDGIEQVYLNNDPCLPTGADPSNKYYTGRYDVTAGTAITPIARTASGVNPSTETISFGAADGTWATGDRVQTSTTGTLPSPLAAATDYYLIVVSSSAIKLATNLANAIAGAAINLTTAGSGTLTVTKYADSGGYIKVVPWVGVSDGAGIELPVGEQWGAYGFKANQLVRVQGTATNNDGWWMITSTAAVGIGTGSSIFYAQKVDGLTPDTSYDSSVNGDIVTVEAMWAACFTSNGTDSQTLNTGGLDQLTTGFDALGTDHCNGTAVVWLTLAINPNLFSGLPLVNCDVRGRKLYDPRTGTTYYSDNAALCVMDYLTNARFGAGLDASTFDVTDAANACDVIVTVPTETVSAVSIDTAANTVILAKERRQWQTGDRVYLQSTGSMPAPLTSLTTYYLIRLGTRIYGLASNYANARAGTAIDLTTAGSGAITVTKDGQPQYTVGGVVDINATLKDNTDKLLSAMRGYLVYAAGTYKVVCDQAGISEIDFDESNITGQWQFNLGANDTQFNKLSSHFVNPDTDWQDDYAVYAPALFLSDDNNVVSATTADLPFTPNYWRANYITQINLNQMRNMITAQFTAQPPQIEALPGAICSVTHSTPGWSGKLFRITKLTNRTDGLLDVVVQEYNAGVYTVNNPAAAEAQSNTTLPDPTSIAAPTGLGADSGTAQLLAQSGAIISRILLSLTVPDDAFIAGADIEAKKSADSQYAPVGSIIGTGDVSCFVSPVQDAVSYDIRARSRGVVPGVFSEWTYYTGYTVVGQTEPPPDVDTFSVLRQTDGTREFSWTYNNPPVDFQSGGFEIRYKTGTGYSPSDWPTMTALHTGLLAASPYETNKLPAGTYTFAIKAVDSTGNECTNALLITATLDDPRLAGSVVALDAAVEGWPGTKTSCFVNPDGALESTDPTTWSTAPATWAAWVDAWNHNPAASFTYEEVIDIGAEITCTPIATAVSSSGSSVTVEVATSVDNITYTAYGPLAETANARYVKYRATVTQVGTEVPDLVSLFMNITASTVDEYLDDLDISALTGANRIGTGDIRLPVANSYLVIKQINVILQGVVAGDNWTVSIVDKNVSPGPRLQFFNNGALADPPLIDAYVKGYPA